MKLRSRDTTKLPNLRRELSKALEQIKMFIPRSCDIGFLCLNMGIGVNNASYDMKLKNQDFETQVERHDETTKFEE